jgi:hypothetical protein
MKNSIICTPTSITKRIKSRRGHVVRMGEMLTNFLLKYLRGRYHSEDLGIDESTILK